MPMYTAPGVVPDAGQGVQGMPNGVPIPVSVGAQAGAPNIANTQVTVDTTAGGVALVAARATRRCVTFVNNGAVDVFLGTGTVSAANGFLLVGTKGAAVTMCVTAAVKAITASGSVAVGVLEEYD